MQIPHLQILGKTEDWAYTRNISHKLCDSVIVRSRVTVPLALLVISHMVEFCRTYIDGLDFYLPSLQLVLCSVAGVKVSPYINHSAVYILFLVL